MAGTLVVAGLWARPLAEAARQGGWRVVALDLFGDADTRAASAWWARIGDASAFAIAPMLLREALQRAAREPDVIGWVAGSGFEACPEALSLRIPGLPLLGMQEAQWRRVREPASFFAALERLGLAHPEISLRAPRDPRGWLAKSTAGSGGWHIRAAGDAEQTPGDAAYWQRVQPGTPMSALFLADGRRARLVALNRLIVRPLGTVPYAFHGAIGPIAEEGLARRMEEALALLVPAFDLRGLASLDFIRQDERIWLLEVNPRPSATMLLHAHAWKGGLMAAHVRAVRGTLPGTLPAHPPGVRACLTVFADRPCRMRPALAMQLACSPDCHDIPAPDATFAAGEPICTVSATAARADAVLAALDARARDLRSRLAVGEELAA